MAEKEKYFRVTFQITEVKKKQKYIDVASPNKETAIEDAFEQIQAVERCGVDKPMIAVISAEETIYKTHRWRELEDVIHNYKQNAKHEKDSDTKECYEADADDLEEILDALIDKDFKKAAELRGELDTLVREVFPDSIEALFESLDLL